MVVGLDGMPSEEEEKGVYVRPVGVVSEEDDEESALSSGQRIEQIRRSDSDALSVKAGSRRCYLLNTSALTTWPSFHPWERRDDDSLRILPM
jgi:hypothetical protein